MKKLLILIPIIWVVFSFIGYWVGYWIFHSPELERFNEHGIAIYGTVTGKEAENHARVKYKYFVAGAEYSGRGGSLDGNPDFDQIEVGQKVIVFYDPDRPEISMMGYPQMALARNKMGIYFSTAVFPIFPVAPLIIILFGIYLNRKNKS